MNISLLKTFSLLIVLFLIVLFSNVLVDAQSFSPSVPRCEENPIERRFWTSSYIFVGRVAKKETVQSDYLGKTVEEGKRYQVTFAIENNFGSKYVKKEIVTDVDKEVWEKIEKDKSLLVYTWTKFVFPRNDGLPSGLLSFNLKSVVPVEKAQIEIVRLEKLFAEFPNQAFEDSIRAGRVNYPFYQIPTPRYTPELKQKKLTGDVLVVLLMDKNGEVLKAEPVCGVPELIEHTLKFARLIKGAPYPTRSNPQKNTVYMAYSYKK